MTVVESTVVAHYEVRESDEGTEAADLLRELQGQAKGPGAAGWAARPSGALPPTELVFEFLVVTAYWSGQVRCTAGRG